MSKPAAKKALKIAGISLGLVVWGIAPVIAASQIHNGDIATGAVNSRTIANGGVANIDLSTDSVNSRVLQDDSVRWADLNGSAQVGFVKPGMTVRGTIGGDFPAFTTGPNNTCPNNCSWEGYASLPFPAHHVLTDSDVSVNVAGWVSGDTGQTQPTTTDTSAGCTGTPANPTAPAGKVCIYVAGGDNAEDLKGYSVLPGTSGSRYGFKLHWVSTGVGSANNTFIDAVWAYTGD